MQSKASEYRNPFAVNSIFAVDSREAPIMYLRWKMKSCAASPKMRLPVSVQTGAMPDTRERENPLSDMNLYWLMTSFSASWMLSMPAATGAKVGVDVEEVLMENTTLDISCMTRCAIFIVAPLLGLRVADIHARVE